MKSTLLLAAICAASALHAWDVPTLKPNLPLIFPDDTQIASRTNVVRVFHPAKKDYQPAIQPEYPWENGICGVYGAANRLGEDLYRVWYFVGWDKVAIADSSDGGRTWKRTPLPDNKVEAGTSVVFTGLHCPAVLLDRFEKDPSRRYKAIGARIACTAEWGVPDREQSGYFSMTSPDGIHWTEARRILKGWDTASLAQNQETGEFFLYHKVMMPLPGRDEERRFVFVSRSTDFEHWTEPKVALAPDEADDGQWIDNPDQRTDFYNMAVFSYAGGFIGFPTIFRITARQPLGKDLKFEADSKFVLDDGPIDVQLATSADGVVFSRTPGRRTMIAAGPEGAEDCQIPGVASGEPITVGDETSLLYYGINKWHAKVVNTVQPVHYRTYRAIWRRWGFASVGTSSVGAFVTRPVKFATPDIRFNVAHEHDIRQENFAKADWGVTVTVLSPTGETLAKTARISTDATLATPVWEEGRRPPLDTPVVLRFDLRAASVYAVECR